MTRVPLRSVGKAFAKHVVDMTDEDLNLIFACQPGTQKNLPNVK